MEAKKVSSLQMRKKDDTTWNKKRQIKMHWIVLQDLGEKGKFGKKIEEKSICW